MCWLGCPRADVVPYVRYLLTYLLTCPLTFSAFTNYVAGRSA